MSWTEYDKWLAVVDERLMTTVGCCSMDLEDQDWASMYENDGLSPREAADMVIDERGMEMVGE